MLNPRLAGRYAKSLFDLAVEKGQLEEVYQDILFMQQICRASREFVILMKSPVVKADKKIQILTALTADKISVITASFNNLMVNKGREDTLPEITDAFVNMYNAVKGIHKVKLTTAYPVSDALKQSVIDKFTGTTDLQHIQLETAVREELVGGFTLEFDNKLVDASILRDLKDLKKQFLENVYIQKLR